MRGRVVRKVIRELVSSRDDEGGGRDAHCHRELYAAKDFTSCSEGNLKSIPSLYFKRFYTSSRCKRCRFDPWVGRIPRRRAWQSPPVFLTGGSHGQRSLEGYRPQGCKESDMTEVTQHSTYKYLCMYIFAMCPQLVKSL